MGYIGKNLFRNLRPITIALIFAAVLRLYQIGTESLWVDEYFSIRDAVTLNRLLTENIWENGSLGIQDTATLNLATRPLYYLLLHLWMEFGGTDADAWLRLLSVPFSVSVTWLTYQLAQRLVSTRTANIAAFMTAVSPLFVGYGQEIRMYALSAFLTLWGTLTLVSILQAPTRWKVLRWTLLRWLAVMSTPLNILLLLPDCLICVWQFRQQLRRLGWIACGAIFVALATMPAAMLLQTKAPDLMANLVTSPTKPGARRMAGVLTEFTMFWPTTDLPDVDDLILAPGDIGLPDMALLYYMLATAVACLLLAWGLFRIIQAVRKSSVFPKRLWLVGWGFIPAFLILLGPYVGNKIWFTRYLLFVAPYFIILLAETFEYAWTHHRKVAIAIAMMYLIGVSGGLSHYYTKLYHDDWKGVAQTIQAEEQLGDWIGLYPNDWDPEYSLPRYYRGGLPISLMAADNAELTKPLLGSEEALAESMLDRLPPTDGRYWLVVYHPRDAVNLALEQAIEERYTLIRLTKFYNSVNDPIHLYLVGQTG
jgi:mannosyltransferase